MPLVQHNQLPSIDRVQLEGVNVCLPEEVNSSLKSLKIGFLNMMPDAAIAATERQFLRLVGSNNNVNCYFYPFSIDGVDRSNEAQKYVNKYYIDYAEIQKLGIDALIITGANVSQPLLQNELFWPQLTEVLAWAKVNVCSTLCSCLATHAAVKVFYDIDRQYLGDKCWGVFNHHVYVSDHPLLQNIDEQVHMCHSRFNDIPRILFEKHEVDVLIGSDEVGIQLAAEKDMRVVYFQGHPEYDDISLLKEYKREIMRYLGGEIDIYPPVPLNYFNDEAMQYIAKYRDNVVDLNDKIAMLSSFPEDQLRTFISNPWKSSASRIFANWVDVVASKSDD